MAMNDDAPWEYLGTIICNDRVRAEMRVVGVGDIGIAVQNGPFVPSRGEWVVVRVWAYPRVPTWGDVRLFARALEAELLQDR